VLGLLLLPIVVAAGLVAFLLWWPIAPRPLSQIVGPPAEVTAAPGRGQVTLRWREVPGAVSYQVFRSDKPDGDYALVSSAMPGLPRLGRKIMDRFLPGQPFDRLPHPPFVDTAVIPGRTYYYRVLTDDGSYASAPSAPVPATVPAGGDARVTIRVDASREDGTLEHKWEVVLGSEHLSYMLKGDLSPNLPAAGAQLRQAHKRLHEEFGIRYSRAHGILMDDLGTYREDATGQRICDWSGTDKVYDMLRADGLKPFVELSFMPAALALDPTRQGLLTRYYGGVISPPRDYAKWGSLVEEFARHLIGRYGQEEVESWFFEVWNEPDFRLAWPGGFWRGSDEDYFRLYDYAAQALKKADPKVRVGGPVAAFSRIVEPFLQHVASANYATGGKSSPLDFLDLHIYYAPPLNWRPPLERYGLEDLPIHYTEWGVSPQWGSETNDLPYGAAWTARGLFESLDNAAAIAYWTGSDYFEELGPPQKFFHGGFGLLGLDGIRKPRYWAFHMLHQLGTQRLALAGEGDGFGGLVNGWATRGDDGTATVLLWNVTFDQTKAGGSAALARQVTLRVVGLPAARKFLLRHFRVDNAHSNVYAAWQAMGRPDWPNAAQLAELHRRDELQTLEPERQVTTDATGVLQIDFELPMPALSLIELLPEEKR
jgi:xylan 1,4-beta-xylosidase